MSSRALFVAPLLLLALIVPSAAVSSAEAELAGNSPNMTHVLNFPHKVRTLEGANGVGGTDIEFVTLPVQVDVDAEGNPIIEDHDFALAGTYRNGLQIIDITDPTQPTTASVYDCVVQQGDVQVFERGGRTYAAYTHDTGYTANITSTCYKEARLLKRPNGTPLFNNTANGSYGTFVVDITNPYTPTTVSFFNEPRGSHNVTVAPGGRYFYNSNSDVGNAAAGEIEVWDLGDFNNPTKVATLLLSGLSSHDITFNATGTRAYSAAVTHTLVLDTTNLAAPTIVGRIFDPAINIHHQSDPVTLKDETTGLERTFLIITDEIAGAAGNAACPGGGLHVYDITGDLEKAPVKVGFWNIPSVRQTTGPLDRCTSHVLRLHPQQKIMTIAWYNAGVRVVDISGLIGVSAGAAETDGNVGVGMQEIGYAWFANGESWSAKTNRIEPDGSFYLYSNDQKRGLDVFRFNGAAPASAEGGTWLTPAQALARARAMGVQRDAQTGPFCMYQGLTTG
jgi:LVIVD repeat